MDNEKIYDEITKLKVNQAEMHGVLEDHGNHHRTIEKKIDNLSETLLGKKGEGGIINRIQFLEYRWVAIKWSILIGIPSLIGYMNYLKFI